MLNYEFTVSSQFQYFVYTERHTENNTHFEIWDNYLTKNPEDQMSLSNWFPSRLRDDWDTHMAYEWYLQLIDDENCPSFIRRQREDTITISFRRFVTPV